MYVCVCVCVQNVAQKFTVVHGSFFCFYFVSGVYVVLCFLVFNCQCQCNQLPGETRLRNDLLCVEWDVKPYTLTHSLSHEQDEVVC